MNSFSDINNILLELYKTDISSAISIDLQLFASAEEEGRTEEPTQHKIQKAREDGKIVKSQELVSSVVLLMTFWVLALVINMILDTFKMTLGNAFTNLTEAGFDFSIIENYTVSTIKEILWVTAPVFGTAFIVAIIVNVAQVGFLWTMKPIKPEVNKISFTWEKLKKRILFSGQTMANLLKAIFKVVVVLGVASAVIYANIDEIGSMILVEPMEGLIILGKLVFMLVNAILIAFVIMSIPDYLHQKHEHRESLKMSHYELKDERKDIEGDPHLRQMLKEKHRELLTRRISETVPKADVVVTNPTHFAVAISYDPEYMVAPQVIAKGKDYMAQRIKEIARDNDVVIIENKPLARELFDEVDIGEYIPDRFWKVIIELLRMVLEIKQQHGKLPKFAANLGS